jgi:hypothetical protein
MTRGIRAHCGSGRLWRQAGLNAYINIPLDSNKGGKRAGYADYIRAFGAAG